LNQPGRTPERTCVGCRSARPRTELVRYVLSPQQEILVDYRQRLPGRGVYTCCDPACIDKAVTRRQLQRGLKTEGADLSAAELLQQINAALLQRIENLLGMARKSGQVVSGGQAVQTALKGRETFAFVLLSQDISAGIADKVTATAAKCQVAVFRLLDKDRIGEILGKGERSVAAVQAGQLADALLLEMQRYKRMSREI
jgi:uncharacterized protein